MTASIAEPVDVTGVHTVAIVDDHLLLVETVRLALGGNGIATVAVTPRPPAELVAALLDLAPTLVLLDLDLGEFGDGGAAIGRLSAAGIRVLIVTGVADRLRVAAALEQGAIGFQPKAAGFDDLIAATHAALAGEPVRPAEAAAMRAELAAHRSRRAAELAPFGSLTEREQATLRELADGWTVHDIARAWVVSAATVRSHVQAVLRKLGATSQLQAVAIARNTGWLDGGNGPVQPRGWAPDEVPARGE